MNCGKCGNEMRQQRPPMNGWWCPTCAAFSRPAEPPTGEIRKAVDNVVSSEAIIGTTTGIVWTVTAHARRPGVQDYTETLNVRTNSEEGGYDGAILLAQEMVLDFEYADAVQVSQ